MRNILKNVDQAIHYWANEVQPTGKSGSVSFDGGKLYSYAALIANIVRRPTEGDAEAPARIVLMCKQSYSPTTRKHKAAAERATVFKVIVVNHPDTLYRSGHTANLEVIAEEVVELLHKAETARTRKDWYTTQALARVADFNLYASFFGLPNRFTAPADAAAFMKDAEARAELARESERLATERRNEETRKHLADELRIWRGGMPARSLHMLPRPALRLSKDGENIETTMGADIPVRHARRLWASILEAQRTGVDFSPTVPVSLGVYRLTTIRANGDVVAGCHDIPFAEIEGIAKALGLVEGVPA